MLTQELDECRRLAEDHRLLEHKLRIQSDALPKEDPMSQSGDTDAVREMAVVRDELNRQTEYMLNLERTNMKLEAELGLLRDQHASVDVLREEKRELEKRARMFQPAQERANRLEAELELVRKEREDE
jgi:mitotic spindle assembly checkpoint protein MAD1